LKSEEKVAIFTIGHGNRGIEEFLRLLKEAEIDYLVDVRAFPGSRRHPQFNREALKKSLSGSGIGYLWEGKALGGRRRPRLESLHVALRNESFRAYADHMESEEFAHGVALILARAQSERVAIMCAERLPWQCHRYLISDYLVAHGHPVAHIVSIGKTEEHRLRSIADFRDGKLIYDREVAPVLELEPLAG
jgi:uncharacterized protein (DUF488 family)